MGATRPASEFKTKVHRQTCNYRCLWAFIRVWAYALMPDARRVAPIRGSVLWYCFVILFRAWARLRVYAKSAKAIKLHIGHLPYYNILHTEHLASYTNTLQLIDYQYFNQCKILPNPPTHILHNLLAATRHKHERKILQHRGAEKSVAPTESSTSLCCKIHRIRQNRLRGGGCDV